MKYFLSLGSNLGDRGKNLSRALYLLKRGAVKIHKTSSLYETEPVDYRSQPWFLNQVAQVSADLNPIAFLSFIKEIEQKMGRKSAAQKEPRIIDIDILLAERTVIQTKELEIPHPRMEKRNFVLIPLKEISPHTVHPVLNLRIEDLWKNSKNHSVVRQINKPVGKEKHRSK